jgi:hypothetical protein
MKTGNREESKREAEVVKDRLTIRETLRPALSSSRLKKTLDVMPTYKKKE